MGLCAFIRGSFRARRACHSVSSRTRVGLLQIRRPGEHPALTRCYTKPPERRHITICAESQVVVEQRCNALLRSRIGLFPYGKRNVTEVTLFRDTLMIETHPPTQSGRGCDFLGPVPLGGLKHCYRSYMRYNGVPKPLSALQERNMALHTACLGHFPGLSRCVNMIWVVETARPLHA